MYLEPSDMGVIGRDETNELGRFQEPQPHQVEWYSKQPIEIFEVDPTSLGAQ